VDEKLEFELRNILKKNRLIWGVVLIGMIVLLLISITIYYLNIIDPLPIVHPQKADNITMVFILIFVIAIFYIKQTVLTPAKLIEKSKKPNIVLFEPLSSLSQGTEGKMLTYLKCIHLLNRNMLIVWFLADLVVLSAFVNFILAPILNKLIMYSFVGLFSLLINFPNFNLYKRIYRYIYE